MRERIAGAVDKLEGLLLSVGFALSFFPILPSSISDLSCGEGRNRECFADGKLTGPCLDGQASGGIAEGPEFDAASDALARAKATS